MFRFSKACDPRGYAEQRYADLPWGYWLRQDSAVEGLLDEQGRVWPSLRAYLWCDRLKIRTSAIYPVEMGCEVLLTVLHALMNRMVGFEEAVVDLFGGSWLNQRHYFAWLEAQDLLDGRSVTIEGRAIARMLTATRHHDAPDLAPLDFATLQGWSSLDRGTTRSKREQVMAAQEAIGRSLRYCFIREPIIRRPAIKLLGHGLGEHILLTRVLWSMTFPDDYARDRMFCWLAHRLDRWQAWGEMAAEQSA
jgi:hypothetical protein